jgi:hypothetical protein
MFNFEAREANSTTQKNAAHNLLNATFRLKVFLLYELCVSSILFVSSSFMQHIIMIVDFM